MRNLKKKTDKLSYLKNNQIRSNNVRLVGGNIEQGIYSKSEAIKIAQRLGLDLIMINSSQNPPICKIEDYNKLIYSEKKKKKDIESKNRKNRVELKELRFSPNTGEGDIEHKLKKAFKFLSDNNNVKLSVQFKGRQMAHKEIGELLLFKMIDRIMEEGYGYPETSKPQMRGRFMDIIIKPNKLK